MLHLNDKLNFLFVPVWWSFKLSPCHVAEWYSSRQDRSSLATAGYPWRTVRTQGWWLHSQILEDLDSSEWAVLLRNKLRAKELRVVNLEIGAVIRHMGYMLWSLILGRLQTVLTTIFTFEEGGVIFTVSGLVFISHRQLPWVTIWSLPINVLAVYQRKCFYHP